MNRSPVTGHRLPLRSPPERETRTVLLGEREIAYTLVRCRRRSIGLKVDEQGLTVRAPLSASRRWLEGVLDQHALWILRKLDEWSRRARRPEWSERAVFPLFGREYTPAWDRNGGIRMLELRSGQLPLPFATDLEPAELEQRVAAWYRTEALARFRERVILYCGKLGLAPPPVTLSSARTQWGSCSRASGIRLSWRLAMFPLRLVDYVVAHEVAHLLEMNHSPAFWELVERLYPEYRAARRELRALA